jgi:hypothetical protein
MTPVQASKRIVTEKSISRRPQYTPRGSMEEMPTKYRTTNKYQPEHAQVDNPTLKLKTK